MSTYNAIRYNVDYVKVGSLKLISTQTASSSSSVSFTSGIDSTYDEYWFIFNNVHPATDSVFFSFNGSTDGGSNYNVTKTTNFFSAQQSESDGGALSYRDGSDVAQGTGYAPLTRNAGNLSDESSSGILKLYNPSSTTYVKHFTAILNVYNQNNRTTEDLSAGYLNTTSAINAIDFKFSSGNIDDGTIQLFGIKQ